MCTRKSHLSAVSFLMPFSSLPTISVLDFFVSLSRPILKNTFMKIRHNGNANNEIK